MGRRTVPEVAAEIADMRRQARKHLVKAREHELAAERLASEIVGLRDNGSELDGAEAVGWLLAAIKTEAEAELTPEMGEDPKGGVWDTPEAWEPHEEMAYDFAGPTDHPATLAWMEAEEAELVPQHERGGRKHAARTVDKRAPLVARYLELRAQGKGITEARYTVQAENEQRIKDAKLKGEQPEEAVSERTLKRICKG
jgi:hypothetical protein